MTIPSRQSRAFFPLQPFLSKYHSDPNVESTARHRRHCTGQIRPPMPLQNLTGPCANVSEEFGRENRLPLADQENPVRLQRKMESAF